MRTGLVLSLKVWGLMWFLVSQCSSASHFDNSVWEQSSLCVCVCVCVCVYGTKQDWMIHNPATCYHVSCLFLSFCLFSSDFPPLFLFSPCEPLTPHHCQHLSLSLALCIYILWDQPWLGRLKWTAVQSTRSLLPLCLIPDLETERERENTKRLLRG